MTSKNKALTLLYTVLIIAFLLTSCTGADSNEKYIINESISFRMTEDAVSNPYMGFAERAGSDYAEKCSLVYIDITFKELQPNSPDEFDFESIDRENHAEKYKEQGKHAVLRFVCDEPSSDGGSDIPDWLMDLTGDGTYYDISYGSGYCPDYSNEIFISYHQKAIEALAHHYDDGFVAYVELGSLGHWGEWHIKTEEDLPEMPDENIRDQYVSHYIDSFSNAKLLMRRPFNIASSQNLGLYNDIIGKEDGTNEWLEWIENGGTYSPTGEENALSPMPDFWKTSPSGGELASSLPIEESCGEKLDETLEMLKNSHTTFIGPKSPLRLEDSEENSMACDAVLSAIGYRLGITKVGVRQKNADSPIEIELQWCNSGVAPLYFDLPAGVFVQKRNGEFHFLKSVEINLCKIMPGESQTVLTVIPSDSLSDDESLYVAIYDSKTKKPIVNLVSDQELTNGYAKIFMR